MIIVWCRYPPPLLQDAGNYFALDTDNGWTGAMRNDWCAAPARLALLPSAAQLTGTILIATIHVLVGAIHAALLMALETAVILFGFVAIGYAVRGIMLGTAEMQSKAVELVSSACTLHTPIILAAISNFLLCAVVATHIRRLVATHIRRLVQSGLSKDEKTVWKRAMQKLQRDRKLLE